ncbi:MAG: M23 family metallopeptidase [Bacteroidetes bacterium]|nr:M23 family metallopeptidase [Bacteroidota bacterium]
MTRQLAIYILFLALTLSLTSCELFGPGKGIFSSPSPHEQYARSLKAANLDRTALGKLWFTAAERSLRDSLFITLPYRESGYFPAQSPLAVGYRIQAERGDVLLIDVAVQGTDTTRVFVDVFEWERGERPDRVLSAQADTNRLRWEVRRSKTHLIRIQPELLRSGRYTLSVTREPLLSFPVQGRNSTQISSFWGANRDGGRRSHEGVDIFAPRGTPALAPVAGYARVGTNNLGGNTVFLRDQAHGLNLYYAHLDSWNVTQGQRVQPGDTLGFIGNTGNARTTGPHLHFGIYESGRGAIDPLPFIRMGLGTPTQTLPPPALLGDTLRLSSALSLRVAPQSRAEGIEALDKNQIVHVMGGSGAWVRVRTPAGTEGYLPRSVLREIDPPLRRTQLTTNTPVYDAALPQAAVYTFLAEPATVPILGTHQNFELIELASSGVKGWVVRQ